MKWTDNPVGVWTPWPALPVAPPRRHRGRHRVEAVLRTVRHPLGALRRSFSRLPLPWRRRLFERVRPPRAAAAQPAPAEWLAELAVAPPARPLLVVDDERLFGGVDPWAVLPLGGLPPAGDSATLRPHVGRAASSPSPIGCVVSFTPHRAAQGRELARTLCWPHAFADPAGRPLGNVLGSVFPRLSVVVVVYRHPELTRLCLEALRRFTAWPNLEILVVDNASPDGAGDVARRIAAADTRVRVLGNPRNRGFAAAANQGVEAADGPLIALLNHDVAVSPGWEVPLLQHLLRHPEVGLAGPATNAAGNEARLQVKYLTFSDFLRFTETRATLASRPLPLPELGFFCVVVRRRVWEELGGLDEGYGLGYFEDADFCRRARARGWRLACLGSSFVHHWQGAAFATLPRGELEDLWEANRRRFLRRRQHAG